MDATRKKDYVPLYNEFNALDRDVQEVLDPCDKAITKMFAELGEHHYDPRDIASYLTDVVRCTMSDIVIKNSVKLRKG